MFMYLIYNFYQLASANLMDRILEDLNPPASSDESYNLDNPGSTWFSQLKQDQFVVKAFRKKVSHQLILW